MARLTIQLPAELGNGDRGPCEPEGASGTVTACSPRDERRDDVDPATRAFEAWVACWAGA